MNIRIEPSSVAGTVQVPASKSLSHRALICAGLAEGLSAIYNLGQSKDIEATKFCLQALGVSFPDASEVRDPSLSAVSASANPAEPPLYVHGSDPARRSKEAILNAGESGSTLRFLIPVAATSGAETTFLGKPSLLMRPLGIYENIFLEQGLPFVQAPEGLHFHGPLQSGLYTVNGDVSSQFLSGLLFAGVLLNGIELAVLPPYQSRSYVDLTVSMLKTFGVNVEEPTDHAYRIDPGARLQPGTVTVESDWSQAAFFLVLGMLKSRLTLAGLAKDSLQGDAVIAAMIEQAGGKIAWKDELLEVSPGQAIPFVFDLADCPDLGPILCVLGAMIPGTNKLIHASRLRIKECDRIAAMEAELKKWGVAISSDEDSITITGKSAASYRRKDATTVCGHNDHRIVMAMAIFALCANSPTIIEGAQAVSKSYPGFFEDLKAIGVCVQETA